MNKCFMSLGLSFSKCRQVFLIMIKGHVSLKFATEKVFLYNLCHMSNVKTMCPPSYYHSGSMTTFAFRYACVVTHYCSYGPKSAIGPLE